MNEEITEPAAKALSEEVNAKLAPVTDSEEHAQAKKKLKAIIIKDKDGNILEPITRDYGNGDIRIGFNRIFFESSKLETTIALIGGTIERVEGSSLP
ncbi:MAG: hypothetical protein JNJ83_01900 [Verrucomicrobiaceae bacterium]|nr:hypothetical protein [Verrucomicrobiaceae bacterium]